MAKHNCLLILAFVFFSFIANAQETIPSIEGMRKNAVSFSILGATPIVGITYDRIVSENVNIEIGVGLPSVGAGFKYYPWGIKESKILYHMGLTGSYVFSEVFDFWGTSDKTGIFVGYLPIGISYFGEKGFNLGVDAGPIAADIIAPWGNVKVGYRF